MNQPVHPLLIPRYLVYALYPDCPFELNQVIPMHDMVQSISPGMEMTLVWQTQLMPDSEGMIMGIRYQERYFSEFPANFRLLNWWDARTVEEFPEYVLFSRSKDKQVSKVSSWNIGEKGYVSCIVNGTLCWPGNFYLMPATAEDFANYEANKKS